MIVGRYVITRRRPRWRAFFQACKGLNPLPTIRKRQDPGLEARLLAQLEAAIRRNPKSFALRWLHRRDPLP